VSEGEMNMRRRDSVYMLSVCACSACVHVERVYMSVRKGMDEGCVPIGIL
jgi:hypothetical protein